MWFLTVLLERGLYGFALEINNSGHLQFGRSKTMYSHNAFPTTVINGNSSGVFVFFWQIEIISFSQLISDNFIAAMSHALSPVYNKRVPIALSLYLRLVESRIALFIDLISSAVKY
jgi:hypothetical protein